MHNKTLVGFFALPFTTGITLRIALLIENNSIFFELKYFGKFVGKSFYELHQDKRANWLDNDNNRSYEIMNEGLNLEWCLNKIGRADLLKRYEQKVEANGNIIEIFG
jgi:hypothetical protein